jgi:PASTA domain
MSETSPRPENARDPDPDRTFADDGGLGDDPDATRDYGRSDPDATQVTPPDPDATRVTPPDPDATRVTPVDPDAWRGRAGVPPTDPVRGAIPPQETEEWTQTDQEEPGRRWWLPILFGLLGVLLVFGIILAMVLANSDNGADNPTPAPSRTPRRTASAASVSPSAAPTVTASPSIVQTTTTVLVPETHGETQAQATGKLEALGLVVRIQFQEDPIATPGTVLASTPTAGSVVPSGSDIVLIIAKAIPSSAPSPVPASTRPAPEESRSPAADNGPN